MVLGYNDATITLFGFGVDSFIEVISGLGIAIMITRIRKYPDSPKSKFEIQALKITGAAFYILSAGLLVSMIFSIIDHHKPETTIWGIVISLISILIMTWLMFAKRSVGKRLNSAPMIADSNCTKVCIYMSVVLLVSSLIYQFSGFEYADIIGAGGLIYFSISEGKEAFEKAIGKECETC